MSEEKMLVKVEKVSVFQRISNFLKKLFGKEKEEKQYNIVQEVSNKENNIISEIVEKRKIIDIQNKYESNLLKEEDLTKEEKAKLIQLYKEQINTLENNIVNNQEILKVYKKKIIEIKNKI